MKLSSLSDTINTFDEVIYKYPLSIAKGIQKIELPENGNVIKVGIQEGSIFLWYWHRKGAPLETKSFQIIMTGEMSKLITEEQLGEKKYKLAKYYLDTVFVGPLVIHVFKLDQIMGEY